MRFKWILGWVGLLLLLLVGCHRYESVGAQSTRAPERAPALEPVRSGESETYPVDVMLALRLAGAHDLEIAFVRERLAEARAQKDLRYSRFLPDLSVSADYLESDGQRQATTGEIVDVHRRSLFASARAELSVDLSETIFQALAAKQTLRAREHDLEASRQQRLLEAALGYYRLVGAGGEVEIAKDAVERSQKLHDMADSMARQGTGLKADVARAAALLAGEQQRLLVAERNHRVASARLATQLRLDPRMRLVPAEGEIETLTLLEEETSLELLLAEALGNRPDLFAAEFEENARLREEQGARWSPWLPRVGVFTDGGSFGGGGDSHFGAFDARANYGVFVGWQWRGMGRGVGAAIRGSAARTRQAAIRRVQLKEAVELEIIESWEQVNTSKARVETARLEVSAASESLRLSRTRLSGGVGLALEVVQSEEVFTRAQISQLTAVIDYNQAQFALLKALGRLGAAGSAVDVASSPNG